MVPALNICETYKYLGIKMTVKGSEIGVEAKAKKRLDELSRAPLKPQQRLWILKVKLLPALHHELVLASCTNGFLQNLDRIIRSYVPAPG